MKTMRAVGVLVFVAVVLAVVGCKSKQPVEVDKAPAPAPLAASHGKTIVVVIDTSMGKIKAELWPDQAPKTVENFLRYTDEKYYDGLIFHRVIPGFMIQGGGMTADMSERATHSPIVNEASDALRNERGTLAMARTGEVNSATGQFFINLENNRPKRLDHMADTSTDFGYCVFGRVIEGMDVVDKIAEVPTASVGQSGDVPVTPITIKSVTRAK